MSDQIQLINLNNKQYYLGYKVVTKDLKSLGLRKNPNIMQFEIGDWIYLSKKEIKKNADDYGGIWAARTLSGAKNLEKYMMRHYSRPTRIFIAALDKILYSNSYRIKTNGIILLEEIL